MTEPRKRGGGKPGNKGNPRPSSPKTNASTKSEGEAIRAKREREVFRLFLFGATYREIASQLDVSLGTVAADVERVSTETAAEIRKRDKTDMLAVQVERLTSLLPAMYRQARRGHVAATREARNLVAEISRHLKITSDRLELSGPDGDPIPVDIHNAAEVLAGRLDLGAERLAAKQEARKAK